MQTLSKFMLRRIQSHHLEKVGEVLTWDNWALTGIACAILPFKPFLAQAMPMD